MKRMRSYTRHSPLRSASCGLLVVPISITRSPGASRRMALVRSFFIRLGSNCAGEVVGMRIRLPQPHSLLPSSEHNPEGSVQEVSSLTGTGGWSMPKPAGLTPVPANRLCFLSMVPHLPVFFRDLLIEILLSISDPNY